MKPSSVSRWKQRGSIYLLSEICESIAACTKLDYKLVYNRVRKLVGKNLITDLARTGQASRSTRRRYPWLAIFEGAALCLLYPYIEGEALRHTADMVSGSVSRATKSLDEPNHVVFLIVRDTVKGAEMATPITITFDPTEDNIWDSEMLRQPRFLAVNLSLLLKRIEG